MEESNSTTSEIRKPNYLSLLQEIDNLSNLSIDLNNPCNVTVETRDVSKIDTIFDNVTENINRISNQLTFQRRAMFLITIFNTLMRVCAAYESCFIISRTSFQLMFEQLDNLISSISDNEDYCPPYASDLFNSMFMNLAKDDLVNKCFKRLLSNEIISIIGNVIYDS